MGFRFEELAYGDAYRSSEGKREKRTGRTEPKPPNSKPWVTLRMQDSEEFHVCEEFPTRDAESIASYLERAAEHLERNAKGEYDECGSLSTGATFRVYTLNSQPPDNERWIALMFGRLGSQAKGYSLPPDRARRLAREIIRVTQN